MPKASDRDTREEILDLARELTQQNSFNWLSYKDLSDRLQIKKASVHYHFPTKYDLGLEMLKSYRALFIKWTEKIRARGDSPAQRLDAYFDFCRRILGKNDRVCPGGVFSLEWNTLPESMKVEVRELLADHRRWLEELIREGRKSAEIQESGSVEEQVALIAACMQGALQVARVQGSTTGFNAALKQLRTIVLK